MRCYLVSLLKRFKGKPRRDQVPHQEIRVETAGELVRRVERKSGYRFSNPALLIQALKHRSYIHVQDQTSIESNERLEFLGDTVLDLLVSHYLYARFPCKREGSLTQMRAVLVNKEALADKAREMDLGEEILLSDAEAHAGGRQRTSILADAYEALIGAIYLDGGLGATKRFFSSHFFANGVAVISDKQYVNYKSFLLEYAQSCGQGQPKYRVRSAQGPDHSKVFTVEVLLNGKFLAQGKGRSKKTAEQEAAREAMKRLQLLTSE